MRCTLLVAVLVVGGGGVPVDEEPTADQQFAFPEGFLFGAATASYQVEGGWNASGKGEGMWDRVTHEHPELILDGSNGDVACDSYHKYKEDVRLLKDLGMNFYRFSISWPRILPTGSIDIINEDGLKYYDNLIDEVIAQGMIPMVTMFHWDLPQAMFEIGGWPSEFIIDYFVDYCELLFQKYGSKVKYWMILNEPLSVCAEGWGQGSKAPAYKDDGRADYLCGHNILKAHGRVYRLYQKEFKKTQNGKVGIAINSEYFFPADETNPDDVAAADRTQHMTLGWFANPIFGKDGDYPAVMKEYILAASNRQKLKKSRLPEFTAEEITMLKGAADFFGLNSYTSRAVRNRPVQEGSRRSKNDDMLADSFFKSDWEPSIASWLYVVPEGFRKLLNFVRDNYGDPDILVTEQGYPDYGGLKDKGRTSYYQRYLLELLKAMHIDKVKVFGYTTWSLLDNYEWFNGYKHRFGIHFVDFNDPNRARTPKMSAIFFKSVIANRTVPDPASLDFPDDPPASGSSVVRAGCPALLVAIAVLFLV